MNYYNEFDQNAVAWLRELIKMGAIPAGDVDERSIIDVCSNDLKGYTQCHFFAGIGGWSLALQRAGIASDRPLWTGSCPCQDFSCAGKQKGFAGERDLWPAFFDLIRECRPELVFGEQVKNAVRHGWLDRLYADLEGEGYACGSVVLGAHSAGADHQRQRIYWLADAEHKQREGGVYGRREESPQNGEWAAGELAGSCPVGRMADAERDGRDERGAERERLGGSSAPVGRSAVGGLVDAGLDAGCSVHGNKRKIRDTGVGKSGAFAGRVGDAGLPGPQGHGRPVEERISAGRESEARYVTEAGGYARNFWSDAVPHLCKDGKLRRFEPGVFPLVAKLPRGMVPSGDPRLAEYADQTAEARVMRLKGYGNAICVDTAVMFIEACKDIFCDMNSTTTKGAQK